MILRVYSWRMCRLGAPTIVLTLGALGIPPLSAKPSDRPQSWVERYVLADSRLIPDSYRYLVERGEEYMSTGRYKLAVDAFEAAMDQPFVELPNFEIVVRIAEAKCLSGDKQSGVRLLTDFDCMLDVEVGARSCYSETQGARPVQNPELSELCFERMCSELYLAYYEAPTEQTRERVAELRKEARRVRRICDDR